MKKLVILCVIVYIINLVLVQLPVSAAVLLDDNFDQYNATNWGPQVADITVSNGKAVIMPKVSQVFLTSTKKYKAVTLEVKLKFNKLSTDSSIFYYLGFQSINPWVYNTCWMTVQDGGLSAGVKNGNEKGMSEQVANVTENKWYNLKIVWKSDVVEMFLDDASVFKTTDKAVIPISKMYVFLSANTLGKIPAELEIDSVTITGESPVRITDTLDPDRMTATLPTMQIGKVGDATIRVADGKLTLENNRYSYELLLVQGLTWQKIYNKTVEADYLMAGNHSPIFMVQGRGFSIDSSLFDVSDVKLSEKGKTKTAQILLSHKKSKVEATLELVLDDTNKMLGTLILKNNSKRAMKLQPIFPIMSRLSIDDSLEDTQYFFPWRSGIVGSVDCDLMYEYGNLAWMQVVSIFNPMVEGGLYVYPLDKTGGFKGLVLKKAGVNPEEAIRHSEIIVTDEVPKESIFEFDEGLGFTYYYPELNIEAGEQYALPKTVFCIYKGDWKLALKDYSQWVYTWYKHVGTPQWFMNCFNFAPVHTPGFWSDEKNKYIAADNTTPSNHIVQWAFWDESPMVYSAFPWTFPDTQPGDYKYHKARGGLKAFNDEIKRIQDKGCRFTVYIDHRFCWSGSEIGKTHGKEWAAMSGPDSFLELGVYAKAGVDGWSMCYFEDNEWADYMAETCGRIVKDTGMDGIYLDELALMFPCYNPSHKHYQEDKFPVSPQRIVKNITKARDAMRKENPEAILMTEHAGSDYASQFYDGSWSQTFYMIAFPFSEKHFDDNSLNYFRFCFPEFKLAEWGDSKDGPNRCFFNGIGGGGKDQIRGQVFKENGDAFASLHPEPLVKTKIQKVLANKFEIPTKTVYTIYNKLDKVIDCEIIEVDIAHGYHWVELVYDNPVEMRQELVISKDVISAKIAANSTICIAKLPEIIHSEYNDGM